MAYVQILELLFTIAPVVSPLMRLLVGMASESRMRARGASDKQVRKFIRDYALEDGGPSP